MILYPAIDILEGKAVRLAQGDFGARTEYDADPLQAAERWVAAGARALHVVDLDGARDGQPVNLEHVQRIVAACDVPVQVGGGLRSLEAVRAAAAVGAARIVLGTAAYRDVDLLDAAVAELGDYLMAHFAAEESFMEQASYPERARHKAAHDIFMQDFTQLVRELAMAGLSPLVRQWIVARVPEWIRFHIHANDIQLGRFLASRKFRPDGAAEVFAKPRVS